MTPTRPTVDASAPAMTAATTAERADAGQELLRDGTPVRVRAIRPDDVDSERRFIETLSPRVRRFRFLSTINEPSAALLRQLTVVDPALGVAYVALIGAGADEQQIGVARFSTATSGLDCEFAIVVSDAWQNKGVGTLLMRRLIEQASARGIETMHSSDAADNDLMRRFAAHLQMQHERNPEDATMVLYGLNVRPPTLLGVPPAHPPAVTRT